VAKLTLNFLPPLEPNIVKLHVYESPTQAGSFAEIEFSTDVGVYPNYISRYTVQNANSATDWFAIAWEDSDGIVSDLSEPIQGGTTTLVQILIDRLMLRDASLNENIAAQEAEAAIAEYYNVIDPLTVDPAISPRILSGLTFMALARAYIARMVTASQANKWSAGIVSMDVSTATKTSWDNIDRLIEMANKELGRNYSTILLLKEVEVASGMLQLKSVDVSRSIIEVE
jgi:hypothetical protein